MKKTNDRLLGNLLISLISIMHSQKNCIVNNQITLQVLIYKFPDHQRQHKYNHQAPV